jgi:hypothetical protein
MVVSASRESYVTFSVILGGLALLCVCTAWFVHPSFWIPAIVLLAVNSASVIWLRSFKVKVDEVGILHTTLLGSKLLEWSEIRRAELRTGYRLRYEVDEPGHGFGPPFRLVVLPKSEVSKPPVTVNIKLISRESLRMLCEELESKLEGVKLNIPPFMQARKLESKAL